VREGVAIWPSSTRRILGRLSLVKQHGILFISWLPYSSTPAAAAAGDYVTVSAGVALAAAECVAFGATAAEADAEAAAAAEAEAAAAAVAGEDWEDAAADVLATGALTEQQQQQHVPELPDLQQQQQQQQQPVLHTLRPTQQQHQQQQQQQHMEVQQVPSAAAAVAAASERSLYAVHPIPLSDVRALATHTSHLSTHHQLTVILVSGLTLPPLYFKTGGVKQLLSVLKQHVNLARARDEPGTYLVNDTADPLQRSLVCLDLTDIMLGAPPPGASSVAAPSDGPLANGAWKALEGRRLQQQQLRGGTSSGGSSGGSSPRGVGSMLTHAWGPLGSFNGGGSMIDHMATMELPVPAAAMAAAAAAAAAAAVPLRGLGSALRGSHIGAKLRHVGAAAVEGASSFVTAAVDGWASDVLRHFEHEVELQEEKAAATAAAAAVDDADGDLVLVSEQQLPGGEDQALAAAYTSAAAGGAAAAAGAAALAGGSQHVAETLVGAFEILEGAPADAVGEVLSIKPPLPPLTLQELQTKFLDPDGVLVDVAGFRQRVFAAGGCVWPRLFPVFCSCVVGVGRGSSWGAAANQATAAVVAREAVAP
jgi:hypothetical protein